MDNSGLTIRAGITLARGILRRRACSLAAVAALVLAGVSWAQQPAARTSGVVPVPAEPTNVSAAPDTAAATADTSAAPQSDTLAANDTSAAEKTSSGLTDTVYYESDVVDYDNENRTLHLYGRAKVKYQNIKLDADTIVYDVENNQFQARGRPQLIEGSDTTVGDIMIYNVKTRRGRVSYSTVRFDDTYFTGENIVKTAENCLYIASGDYTTCTNPDHPHFFFYGDQIKVIPEDMAVGRPVVLNVGDAPIAILPFFVMPLQRGRRSGWLTPAWGGSFSNGGYLDNLGYYYAPNDYSDFTLSAKVQEFNSVVLNAGGRYALRYTLDGSISTRYAFDNRLEDETATQQWALDYRHNQNLAPDGRTTLRGSGSVLSNRSFNQMYSDETSVLEQQQLDANMALSHKFGSINATSNIVWRRNHNLTTDRIQEDIPSLDFNLHNRAFLPYDAAKADEPSWYNNIYYSYNAKANMRRDVYGNDSIPGFTRPGMENNINLNSSQKLMKYFDISPYFNMRSSIFYGAIDTLIKDTLYVRDTIVYKTRDPIRDIRVPDYTTVSETPEYFINDQGDLDTLYTVVKISPIRRHLVRDTLDSEVNAVTSWNTGVNLSTRIYGLFPVGFFGVTAVRHTLTPTIGYAYVPKHENMLRLSDNAIVPFDRTFYDVRVNYDRPRPKAQQLMNLSLSNSFQGKRIVGGAKPNSKTAVTGSGGRDVSDSFSGVNSSLYVGDSLAAIDSLGVGDSLVPGGAGDSVIVVRKTGEPVREEKFDILSASVSTAYDFEADSLHWRDLSLSANTSLNLLRISFSSTFWMYDDNAVQTVPIMREYNIGVTSGSLGIAGSFWDGDLLALDTAYFAGPRSPKQSGSSDAQSWNLNFSPGFNYRARRTTPSERFAPTKSFNMSSSASMKVTNALSVQWNGNYDFSSNQFSHNNYTFYYDLECWEMRFTWRPEKINPGFHFVVNVKKLPDLKWETKETRTTTSSSGY